MSASNIQNYHIYYEKLTIFPQTVIITVKNAMNT